MHTVIADTDVIRQLKLLACYAFRSAADKTDILVRAVILVFVRLLFRILYGSFTGLFLRILCIHTVYDFPEIMCGFRGFLFRCRSIFFLLISPIVKIIEIIFCRICHVKIFGKFIFFCFRCIPVYRFFSVFSLEIFIKIIF